MKERDKAVLIIDDDSRNILVLSAVLKSSGYSAIPAVGMRDAFEKLASNNNIGLILLDMMMPDMDCYQALQVLKCVDKYRHQPVIAAIPQAMAGDREKCLTAGADEYVAKPVDVDALLTKLTHIA